jgi:biotin operon repressor
MTAIKNMDAFDSEGEAVNKVEDSLKNVGVQLRDSNGKFRELQDVIDELAGKWSTLNKEDQLFIAQQIGGKMNAATHGNMRIDYYNCYIQSDGYYIGQSLIA